MGSIAVDPLIADAPSGLDLIRPAVAPDLGCRSRRAEQSASTRMPVAALRRIVCRMNTFFAAVTIAIVVGVAVLAVWVFVIAPWTVPHRRH